MVDSLLALQALTTITATLSSGWLSLPGGVPRSGLVARIEYSGATNTSGNNTAQFGIDYSPDGGTTTYSGIAQAEPLAALTSTKTAAAEVNLPFILPTNNDTSPAIRLTATISGSGTSPTIAYSSNIGNAFP